MRMLCYVKTKLKILMQRSMEISVEHLNLNDTRDEKCLGEFRFRKEEKPIVSNVIQ